MLLFLVFQLMIHTREVTRQNYEVTLHQAFAEAESEEGSVPSRHLVLVLKIIR
jgi:hypothetical protein